jgi:hypothetical protein
VKTVILSDTIVLGNVCLLSCQASVKHMSENLQTELEIDFIHEVIYLRCYVTFLSASRKSHGIVTCFCDLSI